MKQVIINILDTVLPDRLKNLLLHLSFNIARPEFERFAHVYCVAPSMALCLRTMKERGLMPKTIVDVGAYEGEWSLMAHKIWPTAKNIMVEPNRALGPRLRKLATKLNGKFYETLLGAIDGAQVDFYQMKEGSFTGSSVLNERSDAKRTIEKRTLTTLDALQSNFEAPGLLKIDVQGYELEVIKGAKQSINLFDTVLMEVAIIEINEGAPLIRDVINFMHDLDFVACEIPEVHRRPLDGGLSQIDVVFVRKGSPILEEKRYHGP
jgi:FkbM family methyltransferase